MSNMRQILREELARHSPISFARFMELALYCPNFGYYEQLDASPGRQGDFYTSVSVGGLFGELLANQFAERLATMPAESRQIVEAGAHDGRLAVDILRRLRSAQPEVFKSVEYWILEPSANRRKSQEKTLGDLVEKVRWFESWSALPPGGINGVIFANELLDAMPVHRLGWDAVNQKWFEWGVALNGDALIWTKVVADLDSFHSALRTPHSAFLDLPRELLAVLPDGFTTEVCPAAVNWWRQAARALKAGKLITFDYGLEAEQFFTPERKEGTLRAYHQHRQNGELLARPGEQDITSQVNFTVIREAGEAEGLQTEAFLTQARFLTGVVRRELEKNPSSQEWTPGRTRQFQTLTHPELMGRAFQVLIQAR